MGPSEQETQLIIEELRKNTSHRRISNTLGLPLSWVRTVEIERVGKYKVDRPDIEKYLIASKHVDREWDNNDPTIKNAREAYDRGELEMCQGRDGFTINLYAIPRKVRDTRPNRVYFAREEV